MPSINMATVAGLGDHVFTIPLNSHLISLALEDFEQHYTPCRTLTLCLLHLSQLSLQAVVNCNDINEDLTKIHILHITECSWISSAVDSVSLAQASCEDPTHHGWRGRMAGLKRTAQGLMGDLGRKLFI